MATYTARKTPNDFSLSGWYAILPPPDPAHELDGDHTADWVIVGAGFAGLAAARRLTQLRPGDRIIVLDAQRVGWGAAGRNSGFMIDLPHELKSRAYGGGYEDDLKQIELNRAGIAFATEAVEDYGLHNAFNPCGKVHGATNGAGMDALKEYATHLDALDEPYTMLDAADLKRVTGTDYYAGGMHAPGCVQIQPAAYIRGFADGLRSKVEIYENSPVRHIRTGAGGHAVETDKGRISTPHVILTVNGHVESFGLYARRLMHTYTFASMTRELTPDEQARLGGEAEWGIIPAHPMGSSVRRLRENRIVVRNVFTYNPDMETSERQVAQRGKRHDTSFRARFPMLPDVGMEYRWGGHLCLSLNGAHAFGEIEEGLFSACCQQGQGV
ncbi:MAG: NAD(P)/FAD-dependent oxidoreductase, partial [Hyphomicrobiaceae bacterium]